MNLYQEELLDHYHNPRGKESLENPDFSSELLNPSCGDEITFSGIIKEGNILQVCFQGQGCVISQGVASMLVQYVRGMALAEIATLDAETVKKMVGIPLGPTRVRCALLPLQALQEGVHDYIKKQGE